MRSVRFVCHSVCHLSSCKFCVQPISLKVDVMIGPTNRKNLLTFGGDLVPDTDSGSSFHSTSLVIAE